MKFAAVVFVCVLAAASAQFNTGRYNPGFYKPGQYYPGQYNPGQYNKYNPNVYDPFGFYNKNQYSRYQYTTPSPYRPFSTVAPTTVAPAVAPTVAVSPVPVAPVPVVKVVSDARSASILKYGNEVNPDGSYSYYYETDNGIAAQEQGSPRTFAGNPPVSPDVAQGSFSWTSPEGVPVAISYVADENGYQPSGNALPSPPPLPPQIARALEYTAKYHVAKA